MPPIITIEELRASLDTVGPAETVKAFKGRTVPSRFFREFADSAIAAATPDAAAALFLALWPETPAAVLDQLADSAAAAGSSPEIMAGLIRHPRTSLSALQKLMKSGDDGTQTLLAGLNRLAPELAEELLASPSPEVRCKLALNPGISPALQAKLAQDPVPFVRSTLLRRNRLDAGALALLLHDEDLLVRAAAVTGANADDATLLEWADIDEFYTQFFLLQREALPAKVLESLCLSANLAIQAQALARRQKLLPDEAHGLCEHGNVAVRAAVASKPEVPGAVQERLAADSAIEVRLALAANSTISDAAVWALLDSGDPQVWHELAQNPGLSEKEVLELCDHAAEDLILGKLLAARLGLTAEQKALLLAVGGEGIAYQFAMYGTSFPELDEEHAVQWAAHPLPLLRAFAAGAEALPRAVLAKLTIDPAPEVRRALAANPGLPERTAGFLLTDPDPETVALARRRLEVIAPASRQDETTPEPEPEEPTVKRVLKKLIKVNYQ